MVLSARMKRMSRWEESGVLLLPPLGPPAVPAGVESFRRIWREMSWMLEVEEDASVGWSGGT